MCMYSVLFVSILYEIREWRSMILQIEHKVITHTMKHKSMKSRLSHTQTGPLTLRSDFALLQLYYHPRFTWKLHNEFPITQSPAAVCPINLSLHLAPATWRPSSHSTGNQKQIRSMKFVQLLWMFVLLTRMYVQLIWMKTPNEDDVHETRTDMVLFADGLTPRTKNCQPLATWF